MKKVILMIANDGYQPIEYAIPKKYLENNGFDVTTASDLAGVAQASHGGSEAVVDILIEDIDIDNYSGLFIIGGSGALKHLDNEFVHSLLQNCEMSGKAFGAICISPRILSHAGVLKNKKATGWDGDNKLREIFEDGGVEYVKESVVVDGKVVTATGPEVAEEFAKAIVRVLK